MAFVKSSGSKGLHVHVPLDRRTGFDQVRDFAHEIAGLLAARTPDRYTVEQRKDSAVTQVFVDVLRTAHAQTAVAPYAVRARPRRQRSEGIAYEMARLVTSVGAFLSATRRTGASPVEN